MGGKGGGGGSSGGDTNVVNKPWRESQPFLKNLLADAQSGYDAGVFSTDPFTGNRVAPQSGMTQQALGQFSDIATAGNPISGQAQQGFGDFMSGDIYRDLDAVKQNALGDIMPAAMSRFSGSGMLDSTLAADSAGRAATQAIAPIEYGAWDSAQNRKLSALGMAPSLAANSYLDSQMLSMAGQQQDAFDQRNIDAEMAQYYETQNQEYDELQKASALGMGFGGMGGSQANNTGDSGGGTLETIGGIMQTVGPLIAMAFMSDRKLKTDIRRAGVTAEGYPQYRFRYLWDDAGTERLGVMADEVPPEITTEIGGYKAVDYAQVTLVGG